MNQNFHDWAVMMFGADADIMIDMWYSDSDLFAKYETGEVGGEE